MGNVSWTASFKKYSGQILLVGISAASIMAADVVAQDGAQWRGSNRDGIYSGNKLLKSWPEKGPAMVLNIKDLGVGYSSPAVTKDRIYVTGMIDSLGCLFAFDHKGTSVWKSTYGPEWNRDHPGVRGTPTVDGNRIYLTSGKGLVVCINAADGKEVWAVDMIAAFEGGFPNWGYNESVLINGNHAICTPGGNKATVITLDKTTGKTLWSVKIDSAAPGYCSPVKIIHAKKEILVTMTSTALIGLDPASGKLLWKHNHPTKYGVNANTPVYANGNLICYSGYGQGAQMLKISPDGMSITKVWENPKFDVQIGGAVLLGNNLYGSGQNNPAWQSMDIQTGETKYSSTELGRGSVVSAAGLLYCYRDNGALSLVQPGADKFTVVSTMPITMGSGPHWAHPVIVDGKLYLRHGDMLMVYNIGRQ